MIIVIRISGLVEVPMKVNATLDRIRLRRKYSAIILKEGVQTQKLLQKIRNFAAYGIIDKDTLKELLLKRGKSIKGGKIDAEKVMAELDKKGLEELGIKPFFRLHPARGGINTKKHYPIQGGVLGDNKESINELVRRML